MPGPSNAEFAVAGRGRRMVVGEVGKRPSCLTRWNEDRSNNNTTIDAIEKIRLQMRLGILSYRHILAFQSSLNETQVAPLITGSMKLLKKEVTKLLQTAANNQENKLSLEQCVREIRKYVEANIDDDECLAEGYVDYLIHQIIYQSYSPLKKITRHSKPLKDELLTIARYLVCYIKTQFAIYERDGHKEQEEWSDYDSADEDPLEMNAVLFIDNGVSQNATVADTPKKKNTPGTKRTSYHGSSSKKKKHSKPKKKTGEKPKSKTVEKKSVVKKTIQKKKTVEKKVVKKKTVKK